MPQGPTGPRVNPLCYDPAALTEVNMMKALLLIVTVACLVFSATSAADAKGKGQTSASQQSQRSMAPRKPTTLKSTIQKKKDDTTGAVINKI